MLNPPIVSAILGPTNTGKTHYAIERMLARRSGVIGLPLRLLAREVYDKIKAIKGDGLCALITGEEKILPKTAQYFVCTVEAMPTTREFAFAAIDEIQLMAHPERGHIFTDRLLHMRGSEETLFLGAETARDLIKELLPDIKHDTRERFSTLSYSGHKKITRLPKRSVIVAFSANEVYAIAELIRRHRGGAAIVMGALSPRTRNAQAALYQAGEVDFLVATDAVGMGLNLDADHVAFASLRKFDGRRRRQLNSMEAAQIAGRAGRFRNNGTFGTTGDCQPLSEEMVSRIENHIFEDLRYAEWRNFDLKFDSLERLMDSLARPKPHRRLRRVALPTDEMSLEQLSQDKDITRKLTTKADVKLLWEVCQIPDFRNLTIDSHVTLIKDIYAELLDNDGMLSDDFLKHRIARLDHIDGNVDILSIRLAQIRTWTYCTNKVSWINDAEHWVNFTRKVEDRLSDALHERLTARFVDRRTSALLKGMGRGGLMTARIDDAGKVMIDDHEIGVLKGLIFIPDKTNSDAEAKALQASAEKYVVPEINRRLTSLSAAQHAVFTLSNSGEIMWGEHSVGKISSGGTIFNPDVRINGADMGDPQLRSLAEDRMRDFLRSEVTTKLSCLTDLKMVSEGSNPDTIAEAKGFAYQMLESHGHLDRSENFQLVKDLSQDARRQLRSIGVVFGQYDIFMRQLLKPKPATLLSLLLAYGVGGTGKAFIPFAGVTSLASEGEFDSKDFSKDAIFHAGYRAVGPRIVRFDILNRLAELIRQAQSQSSSREFQVMQEMLALLGCTFEDMRGVLTDLGYQSITKDNPPETDKLPEADLSAAESAEVIEPINPETDKAAKTEAVKTEAAKSENESEVPQAEAEASNKAASSKKSKELNVFHHREDTDDGTVTYRENREFWSMPFKRKNTQKRQNFDKSNRKKKTKHPKSGGTKNFRGKEPKTKVEDSPFAALANWKTDDSQKGSQ